MTVKFWTFAKRQNSTKRPSGNPAYTFACTLKDASGILNPTLEIYQSAAFNPYALNYCEITEFHRYYRCSDWTWILGRWECSLKSDPLASFKTEIGVSSKYVVRSASQSDGNFVDTFFPPKGNRLSSYSVGDIFTFSDDYSSGGYVLGVANRDSAGAGAVSYYVMSSSQIRALVQFMLPQPAELWTDPITTMTDSLYRVFVSPFDYIKSCKWFPVSLPTTGGATAVSFGAYSSNIQALNLDMNTAHWSESSKTLPLPNNWSTSEAKYKTSPFCRMYLMLNPWGIIELNPLDFYDSTGVTCSIKTDFISGDCMLTISNGTREVGRYVAPIGIDINLSAASINAGGLMGGLSAAGTAVAAMATGGASIPVSAIALAGGIGEMAMSAAPSASGSVGQNMGGAAFYDGIVRLLIYQQEFASEDVAEFGKPLYQVKQLNTLSGYIKCADGEVEAAALDEELTMIADYLTNGFFFE